jgi:transcriptional regulator with XRE-family HTH domain
MDITPQFDFTVLRELRKRSGLTIQEVSSQSGVSPSVISKLERNQSAAELDTLFRLARTFGLSVTDLLSLAESPFAHRVQESAYENAGFFFRKVRYANVRLLYATAKAGEALSRPDIHGDDYEVCWVLEGRLKIRLPHEECELTTGDSLQFDAILEHTYEALEDTRFVVAHMRKDKRY